MHHLKKSWAAVVAVFFATTLASQSLVMAETSAAPEPVKTEHKDKEHKRVKKSVVKKERKKHKAGETNSANTAAPTTAKTS